MKAKFRAVKYQRELPQAIITAHGSYKSRQGVVIKLSDDSGNLGIGDAAPLPGFSRDSFEDLCRGIDGLVAGIQGGGFDFFQDFFETSEDQPSLTFGLGTALESLNSSALGVPLSRWLAKDAATRVAVNGLLGDAEPAQMATQALQVWQKGHRTLKVKMAAGAPSRDVARILAIVEAVPLAKLRLDANGGWTVEQAREVLGAIPNESIDFVEQPLAKGRIKDSWTLCCDHGIRLALDEEVSTVQDAMSIIDQRACDVIVLKPMVLGSLRASYLLAQAARARNIEVIYTSSWESDIGIAATLHLAAALGPNPPAMGLSTAGMIADGIVSNPLKIENGYLKVPEGPGLGMELAPEILERLK